MKIERKRLGAVIPVIDTDTVLYTVPSDRDCVVSSIAISNFAGSAAVVKFAHVVNGTVAAAVDWFYYTEFDKIDTEFLVNGLCMGPGDSLIVNSDVNPMNFMAWGQERCL